MKTLALTLAASLMASSAFAGGLFDVNEAPINYGTQNAQVLDIEATASIGAPAEGSKSVLFDVNEAPINYGYESAQVLDIEATASIGAPAENSKSVLFDVADL